MKERRDLVRIPGVVLLAALFAVAAAAQSLGPVIPVGVAIGQAEEALQKQELQLAESHYRDALDKAWDLASSPAAEQGELHDLLEATLGLLYRNLGVLCEQSRRPQQAAEHFSQADAFDPPDGPPRAHLGAVDLRQSPPPAELVVAAPRLGKTEEELRSAIAAAMAVREGPITDKHVAREISDMHQDLARIALARGEEEAAAAELRTAADLGTLDRDLGLWLADVEAAARNFDAARRILQVVNDAHSSPRALVQLAELTWGQGPAKAAPILVQALQLAPKSEEVLGHTANALLAADEPEKALEILAPLMAMQPDVVLYVRLLAEAHTKLGELDEAEKTLRQAIAMEPSYMRTRLHLAGLLLQKKDYDAAEKALNEILAIDPERPEAKDFLEFLAQERAAQQSDPL